MAKLYFYYSAMNAGKSTTLLQSSYNYRERGMQTLLLTPAVDNREGTGNISSRIGLSASADIFTSETDLYEFVVARVDGALHCVMIDEAQFLTHDQVLQLGRLCDDEDIPVLTFGIRTDFQGEPFEGSLYLLALADNLKEIKGICGCGRKATMVLRVDETGQVATAGKKIVIGGNDEYVSVCRKHTNQLPEFCITSIRPGFKNQF